MREWSTGRPSSSARRSWSPAGWRGSVDRRSRWSIGWWRPTTHRAGPADSWPTPRRSRSPTTTRAAGGRAWIRTRGGGWKRTKDTPSRRGRPAESGLLARGAARLQRGLERGQLVVGQPVGMALLGEGPAAHVRRIGLEGGLGRAGQVGISLDEAGRLALGEAEQVVPHEDLPIAVGPRADADGGDLEQAADAARTGCGDRFHDPPEAAPVQQGDGVIA